MTPVCPLSPRWLVPHCCPLVCEKGSQSESVASKLSKGALPNEPNRNGKQTMEWEESAFVRKTNHMNLTADPFGKYRALPRCGQMVQRIWEGMGEGGCGGHCSSY